MNNKIDVVSSILDKAKRAGSTIAEVYCYNSSGSKVGTRMGKLEKVISSDNTEISLRVIKNNRQAIVSAANIDSVDIDKLIERAIDMANHSPEDELITTALPEQFCKKIADLAIYDDHQPEINKFIELAKEAEQTALSFAPIKNSEGAILSSKHAEIVLASTEGFVLTYPVSSYSISLSVIATDGSNMETDYDYSATRFFSKLDDPKKIGTNAAQNAIKKLNSRKIASTKAPIVFAPRVAKDMLAAFAMAINGAVVGKGTSFLKNLMGEQIFNSGINIFDDPTIPSALGSRPFDGEAIAGIKKAIVKEGVLQSWLLDLRSAKHLNLTTTGNATRSIVSPPAPSVSNFYLQNGTKTEQQLLKEINTGLYVTDLIGHGTNIVTGDFSVGANGFWVENGEITYAVNEITIASNLIDMFKSLIAADNLEFKYGINAPSIAVELMTIAGE